MLLGLPLLVGLSSFLIRLLSRFLEKRGLQTKSQANSFLREARQDLKAGRDDDIPRKLERALFESIERATLKNVRGILRDQIPDELKRAGLRRDLCDACGALLAKLDQIRYDAGIATPAELIDQTDSVVRRLGHTEKARKKQKKVQEAIA
jgi:hypothetical protein